VILWTEQRPKYVRELGAEEDVCSGEELSYKRSEKTYIEKLHNNYPSSNIIRTMKSRNMK
jgi:hypothetical protein